MREHSDLRKHAGLFDEMGRALGLDLQEEAVAGRLQFGEIAEAVLRCAKCARPQECAAFLANVGKGCVAAAPDYCRNKDLLQFLQEEIETA